MVAAPRTEEVPYDQSDTYDNEEERPTVADRGEIIPVDTEKIESDAKHNYAADNTATAVMF